MKWVVITDLDGTLLDATSGSVAASLPAFRWLKKQHIPVVFCSSKTRSEQESLQKDLGVRDPFIVENGGAVLIPPETFADSGPDLNEIRLGPPAEKIRHGLTEVATSLGMEFEGTWNVSDQRFAAFTGLSGPQIERARQRWYSETIFRPVFSGDELRALNERLGAFGLVATPGSRFLTVTGRRVSKGRAVTELLDLYRRHYGVVRTVGLGDGPNDESMLGQVDEAFLVQQRAGHWARMKVDRLCRIDRVGPAGWQAAIDRIKPRIDAVRDGVVH